MPEIGTNSVKSELNSWKEIGAYLGVDPRTCQRWEKKYGLPVLRMGDSSRARIFARKEDIDAWRARIIADAKFNGENPWQRSEARYPNGNASQVWTETRELGRPRKRYIFFAAGLLVLAVAALGAKRLVFFDRRPADFRIEGSALAMKNAAGRDLWRFDSGIENLAGERFYREHFQIKTFGGDPEEYVWRQPLIVIRDLEGDGTPEVLFATRTEDATRAGTLVCLDARGRKRWEVRPGRELTFGAHAYSAEFVPDAIETHDVDGDGRLEVLFVSHSRMEFPTRIMLLGADGGTIGDYWNVGQINDFDFADLDGDGTEEILLAGQNNSFGRPCLVVLDPRAMSGCSPHTDAYRCEELGPGAEKYYVLMPLSPVDELIAPGIAINQVEVADGAKIRCLSQHSILTYVFDLRLNLQDVQPSHIFARRYGEALRRGLLKGPYDEGAIIRSLAAGIRYYDGAAKTWTNEPAMSNPPPRKTWPTAVSTSKDSVSGHSPTPRAVSEIAVAD